MRLVNYTVTTANGPEPGPSLPPGEFSAAATELYFATTSSSVGISGTVVSHGSNGTTITSSSFGAQGTGASGGGAATYGGYDAAISGLEGNVIYTVVLTNVRYGDGCRGPNQTTGSFLTN